MKYVKLFESWSEELVEEVPHQDLYETLEDLLDAWKEWKENDDEDKDEEELHDVFMEKLEKIMDDVKDLIKEEEEEEDEDEEPKEEEEKEEEDEDEEPKEDEDDEEMKEGVEVPKRPEADLSQREGSITYHLERLIPKSGTMSFDELMSEFMSILNSPEIKASAETRAKWRSIAAKIRSKAALLKLISDIYLAGSGMRSTPKKRN